MTATVPQMLATLEQMGSDVTYHREGGGTPCPCRSPEGFRDPAWHRAHPLEPVCNEEGFLALDVIEFTVKAAVQPATPQRFTRPNQRADALLGDVQRDDKLGIFPVEWNGNVLDFTEWSDAGEDFILYDNHRYIVIAADKVPDVDGDPNHHWEVGLRLIKSGRPTAVPITLAATSGPVVIGTTQVGIQLSSTPGTWIGDQPITFTYQWYAADDVNGNNEVPIVGATEATFTPTGAEQGRYVRIAVDAHETTGDMETTPTATQDTEFSNYQGPVV
jgi:hypothetical protein